MLNTLSKKILEMYNCAFTRTRINNELSNNAIEREKANNAKLRLNDAKVCLDYIKSINEKLEKRINDLEEIRNASEKAGVEFRYVSELEFLKELRG